LETKLVSIKYYKFSILELRYENC